MEGGGEGTKGEQRKGEREGGLVGLLKFCFN